MAKYYDRCWNPVFGCSGCFAGCDRCYAKDLMKRRGRDWQGFGTMKINLKQLHKRFDDAPSLIAVCTQSDLFQGESGADTWLVDAVMRKCNASRQHRFLFLTKFSSNMRAYFENADGGGYDGLKMRLAGRHINGFDMGNFAFGVTICCNADLHRLDDLKTIPAKRKFVAFEPLLEEIRIEPGMLDGIGWVIAGAETGDDPRPCETGWLKHIVETANGMHIPVFVNAARTPDGKVTTEFDEMDESLRRNDIPF